MAGPLHRLVRRVPLGLKADPVEPERVLADDPVDARVTAAAGVLDDTGAAVTHLL
jgi:hypothetical protein